MRWSVAAVAPAVISRTDRSASGLGDWTEAWNGTRYDVTDIAASFAVQTDTVRGDTRLASFDNCDQDFDQLVLVDRTSMEFEVDMNVIGNRC